jgi:hypothetical protein
MRGKTDASALTAREQVPGQKQWSLQAQYQRHYTNHKYVPHLQLREVVGLLQLLPQPLRHELPRQQLLPRRSVVVVVMVVVCAVAIRTKRTASHTSRTVLVVALKLRK